MAAMLEQLMERYNLLEQQQRATGQALALTQTEVVQARAALSALKIAAGQRPLPDSLPNELLAELK
jgi:hypothetical protein